MKYEAAETTTTTNNNININTLTSGASSGTTGSSSSLFSEQVGMVTNLFERWNDCERTVVIYALLKRLRYPSLKFLQYSIDSNITQNLGSQSNLSTVVVDINANNPSYLQNLLNAYKTSHMGDVADALSSSSSDKDSLLCFGSDFQITNCDERKLYGKKEDILHEVLTMLPLLKPGNEEAKLIYLALMPIAVKDTMRQIVPTDLVQQIFSYLLIHPAISSDDRKSLNVWLRHLEELIQSSAANLSQKQQKHLQSQQQSFFLNPQKIDSNSNLRNTDNVTMTSSLSSASSTCLSSASCSSASNISVTSSAGNAVSVCATSSISMRNADWQTIAPPSKQHHHTQPKSLNDWSNLVAVKPVLSGVDQLCDNLNGITLNELASSQNSLGLSLGATLVEPHQRVESSTLVNGVVAAAAASVSVAPSLFCSNSNPIINIIHNNNNSCNGVLNVEDHDTSFSKNGTEILDFEPNTNAITNSCDSCNNSGSNHSQQQCMQDVGYASILINNCDPLDINRWSLDSKLAALKTRRSNSLTTQTISTSSSSSNSSVITVNDNCSNSTENLTQYANKPRSFSLSIEHQRGGLTNSGSDTRLDDFKPNYIKFHTRNVGMSNIGLWLKSLRLHKYIDLFKNMSYEEMLHISEEYLQSLGVTKGASHKLALCIEKLKDRTQALIKLEQDLLCGQIKIQTAVEELANLVLTPMKPMDITNSSEDNVALRFLAVIDLVASFVQKDVYGGQDDENISMIMWILDRSIHNEAFIGHINQLKELKFKMSKLKMSIVPKLHHSKNCAGSALNKPRWNGKSRKSDPKNGSNDRINHRKNSNDMLNFSLSCLQQHQLHNGHQPHSEYEKFHHLVSANSSSTGHHQYKSSSYPNFMSNQHHQLKQQQQQQKQQHHQLQQQLLQNVQIPQHPQHRRSLNNLIIVSGQQTQKLLFKPSQGILTTTNTSTDNLQMDNSLKQQQHQHQQRKASLSGLNNNFPTTQFTATVTNTTNTPDAVQQQQPKKTMAAVVMENLAKFDQHFTLF